MDPRDLQQLVDEVVAAIVGGASSVGVLGFTPTAAELVRALHERGCGTAVQAVYARTTTRASFIVPVRGIGELSERQHDLLVVAADEDKESILLEALPHIQGLPRIVIAGHGHFRFRDRILDEETSRLLVPSLANGYPHTLTHLYQCLSNAARLGLRGVVAEFGMFKGGTTMLLSRLIERLGAGWRVIGFDTFDGFPARRSVLDMYAHPDCVFPDVGAVQRYLHGRDVEIVQGDVVSTCHRLDGEDVVLSFIDTDNYTSARSVLDVVRDRTVVGGAIVFDHFTGVDRFRYTLGERLAGKVLLEDARYFHLHGTGVFFRQR